MTSRDLTDAELRAILDGMGRVMEKVLNRLDDETRALHRLTAAVEALGSKKADGPARPAPVATIDYGRVARATDEAVRGALGPTLAKLVDALEAMTGAKALRASSLKERLRALNRQEGRQAPWRVLPWAVVVGIPLVLVTVLALLVPRAAAQTSLTCEATGGTWYEATERTIAACMFPASQEGW